MSYKAEAIAHESAANLKLRVSLTITEGTQGTDPTLLIGAAAAGSTGAFVKIIASPTPLAFDILGLATVVPSPCVTQIAFEANPAGGAGADVNTYATILPILGEFVSRGTRVEIYLSANGTAPSNAAITGVPVASFDISAQYKATASQ